MKSKGVPLTGLSSPVGIRPLSTGVNWSTGMSDFVIEDVAVAGAG